MNNICINGEIKMLKDEFDGLKKLSGNLDKITKVLKMQENGVPRKEIAKETEFSSETALSNFMKRNGYRSENKKYIKEDAPTVNTTVESNPVVEDVSATKEELQPKQEVVEIGGIEENRETLLEMIKWFKENIKNQKQETTISLDFDKDDEFKNKSFMVSVQVKKKWDEYTTELKKIEKLDKQYILTQALIEFMNNHPIK